VRSSPTRHGVLGEHLANTSVGNSGIAWVTAGNRISHICRAFVPIRALRYRAVSALFRLDKAEVTGSSPVSPIAQKPCKSHGFCVSGGGP
jgi:hypothetical protein